MKIRPLSLLVSLLFLASCETMPQGIQQARLATGSEIQAEPPGDYFIGRRYYKPDFKFWGYVRRPGQPWSTAQLVMLNENEKLAPDREQLNFGSDNNYEYKLYGNFSGDKVYEPASNGYLSGIRPEKIRTHLDQSAADFQEPVQVGPGRQPISTIEKPE